ncbi:hypothetical protein OAS67_01280 [Alphaproteobacteria bacterium]|nr:hypothetical protein [Alphaproteobacteria bacterium]
MQTLVLTFIAKDRPGLVERLSRTVAEQGGNWLESRMAQLADSFAGIARVGIAVDQADTLLALDKDGFHLVVEASQDSPSEPQPAGLVMQLDLSARINRASCEIFRCVSRGMGLASRI